MSVLVTGAAGFIGSHVAARLLGDGAEVVGLDDLNPSYSVALKRERLKRLVDKKCFRFVEGSVDDWTTVQRAMALGPVTRVIHLAAQVGVRQSLQDPMSFVRSNLAGFATVLDAARLAGVDHVVYASASSVYGANAQLPFSEHQGADHPLNLYAATKRSNELIAHSYSDLYQLPTTGLRFFTVYGPWGRPDSAPMLFAHAILSGKPIPLFGGGHMWRDFTYIDDVVESIVRVADRPARANPAWNAKQPDPGSSRAPYRVFNVGNAHPVEIIDFVRLLERGLKRQAILDPRPMQAGEALSTRADSNELAAEIGFRPDTQLSQGVRQFVAWFRDYFDPDWMA
jgi:UDP-glucuronate 4-epimerase